MTGFFRCFCIALPGGVLRPNEIRGHNHHHHNHREAPLLYSYYLLYYTPLLCSAQLDYYFIINKVKNSERTFTLSYESATKHPNRRLPKASTPANCTLLLLDALRCFTLPWPLMLLTKTISRTCSSRCHILPFNFRSTFAQALPPAKPHALFFCWPRRPTSRRYFWNTPGLRFYAFC